MKPILAALILTLAAFGISGCGDDASTDCNSAETCGVFELVNEERDEAGVEPLGHSAELQVAAQLHAEDMKENGYFSHSSLDGRNFVTRVNEAGYTGMPRGENIAAGQRTPEAVMSSWMSSPGHRNNILNSGYDEIGIGHADGIWVQVFGSR